MKGEMKKRHPVSSIQYPNTSFPYLRALQYNVVLVLAVLAHIHTCMCMYFQTNTIGINDIKNSKSAHQY